MPQYLDNNTLTQSFDLTLYQWTWISGTVCSLWNQASCSSVYIRTTKLLSSRLSMLTTFQQIHDAVKGTGVRWWSISSYTLSRRSFFSHVWKLAPSPGHSQLFKVSLFSWTLTKLGDAWRRGYGSLHWRFGHAHSWSCITACHWINTVRGTVDNNKVKFSTEFMDSQAHASFEQEFQEFT